MKKFKIRYIGTSTVQEEIAFGESFEQLQAIYKTTGDEVELVEELPYDPPKPKVKPVPQLQDTLDEFENTIHVPPFDIDIKSYDPPDTSNIKYFKVGKQKLMMKGGILYNRVWKDVEDSSEYRIMSTKTGKLISLDGKQLQILDWLPVDDEPIDDDNLNNDKSINEIESIDDIK